MKTLIAMLMIFMVVHDLKAQTALRTSVFGNGGIPITDSAQYIMIGTLGQTAAGSSAGVNTILNSGFWYSVSSIITDAEQADEMLPKAFVLYPNYPNPFNPSTTIRFDLPKTGPVRLIVYNILGQQVRTLANGRMESGRHRVTWDGTNDRGAQVSTGIYVYRMVYGNKIKSRKLMLLK